MNRPPSSVAVIGGGVIGASIACHLLYRGWRVTVIEKDAFGRGSSWGNCGIILPSHLLPLNSAKNLLCGLRWLLKKDAPLYIRPRLDPTLVSWLAGFALRCRRRARRRIAGAVAAMLGPAVEDFAEWVEAEGIDCEWGQYGAIHLFRTEAGLRAQAAADAETKRLGKGCRPMTLAELRQVEPAAAPDTAGAWVDENAAHLRPDALMAGLKSVLERRGASIREETAFVSFEKHGGRAAAAVTSRGPVRADAFVVAAGAWTPLLSRALGTCLPIQPGKGYSVTLAGADRILSRPCFFEEARCVATPWPSGLRLGGTMEFSGFDDRLNRARIDALFAAAGGYLRVQDLGRVTEEWCGWRPMTPDGLPVVDRLPHLENVVVAAGHNMLGISMAPSTGKLVAEMLSGETPHIDPAPYRLARFGRWVK